MRYRDPVMVVDRPYIQVEHMEGLGLYFNANADDMTGRLFTSDPLEAAAAMMYSNTISNVSELWRIDFSKYEPMAVDAQNALYWITGGYEAWTYGNYVDTWNMVAVEFVDQFSEELYDRTMKCKTMLGLKKMLHTNFSSRRILEFALSEKLLML